MADDGTPVVIASYLNSMEAGMLRGLLESAGIGAVVIDTVGRTAYVEAGMVGAQLAVRAADAERAREIIRSAGVFPGPASDEPVEIPEEEWAGTATAGDRSHRRSYEPVVRRTRRWVWPVIVAAVVLASLYIALAG